MKVAAYQAPLLATGSMHALGLIQKQVRKCEAEGITVLCCPEAILGGLADDSGDPTRFALRSDDGQLASALTPLASDTVTSIIGFSELASDGTLYNAAVIFQSGKVVGLYRKIHPAIRRSVYAAGSETPVFRVGELIFGVVICNDSNYPELVRRNLFSTTYLFVVKTKLIYRLQDEQEKHHGHRWKDSGNPFDIGHANNLLQGCDGTRRADSDEAVVFT